MKRVRTAGARPRVKKLLRQLLDCLDTAPGEEEEEVILKVELDGVHYALLRVPDEESEPRDDVRLSPREKEVVRLVSKGLPNRTIAAVLDISHWTVSTHVRRVFAKLEVNSRAEMVARALSDGLLEPME